MYHTAAETAFVDQLEVHTYLVGEGPFASSDHDGVDEQVVFVDQPGLDRGRSGSHDESAGGRLGWLAYRHPFQRISAPVRP